MEIAVIKEANEAIDRNVDAVEALLDEITDCIADVDALSKGAVEGCVEEIRARLKDILTETLAIKFQYKYK